MSIAQAGSPDDASMKTLLSLPRQDGFWMPPEHVKHGSSLMLFPARPDNWRLSARPAQESFAHVANVLSQYEKVKVGVLPAQLPIARRLLTGEIELWEIEYDDAWVRDTGPTFLINSEGVVRGIDWEFNSWGGLFESWERDNQVARRILEYENMDRYKSNIILEGGAIHVDGEGTLLTTSACVLNCNRNSDVNKAEIEEVFRNYLGAQKVIWLPRGLYLDETGGHVDNLACFASPGVVLLSWTDDKTDPQWQISQEAFDVLRTSTDAKGRALEIHKLHLPTPTFIDKTEAEGFEKTLGTISREAGTRLPASYINFYLGNGCVLVPTFTDPMDAGALDLLQSCFPDRQVVGINAREILLGGGTFHCIVQQIPYSESDQFITRSCEKNQQGDKKW